ncbi:hypothetical protein G6F50_015296 [Rhizopus delemar]|uniref:Uncharacterized protein n=1 Tax=Rhizopus delemar TaxID=936053 RepID=A0A9P6XYP2_9FUNG|nr:hypothetical protein G6F50_015296 [Rhizopus delemar]
MHGRHCAHSRWPAPWPRGWLPGEPAADQVRLAHPGAGAGEPAPTARRDHPPPAAGPAGPAGPAPRSDPALRSASALPAEACALNCALSAAPNRPRSQIASMPAWK